MTRMTAQADWIDVGALDQVPVRGARTVALAGGVEIAVFRTGDDAVFALLNRCPHKGGTLAQGIVHGHKVACPLHNLSIALATGVADNPEEGCTPTVPVQVADGRILLGRAAVLALIANPAPAAA